MAAHSTLKNSNENLSQLAALNTAEPSSEDVKLDLKEDIRALTISAKTVDEAFDRVKLGLLIADRNEYKYEDGSAIPKLTPGWLIYETVCDLKSHDIM